jgi:hypothetical protein
MSKISQREAQRLRKRVMQLESADRARRACYGKDYAPGWVNIATVALGAIPQEALRTARLLGCPIVAVPADSTTYFYAVKA